MHEACEDPRRGEYDLRRPASGNLDLPSIKKPEHFLRQQCLRPDYIIAMKWRNFIEQFMQYITEHKAIIDALCKQYRVRKLYVFGSVLSERFSDTSDIDLLVDFSGVDLIHYADNYYNFKFALEEALHRSVDLIEEQAVHNPFFRQSIDTQRQILYAA
ncbi:MAG: nucleotidyltransferase family protein [Flavisolibacter sp.]